MCPQVSKCPRAAEDAGRGRRDLANVTPCLGRTRSAGQPQNSLPLSPLAGLCHEGCHLRPLRGPWGGRK